MLYSFKTVKYGIKYWLPKELKRIKYKLDPKECCIMGVVINVESDQCDVEFRLMVMPDLCLMSIAALNHL